MTDETTAVTPDETTAEAGRPRRRRRATAPAGSPQAAPAPSSEAGPAVEPAEPVAEEAEETAEPEVAETAEPEAEEPVEVAEEAVPEPPAPPARRRRRATAEASAPVTSETSPDEATAEPAPADVPVEAPVEQARPARQRGRKKAAALAEPASVGTDDEVAEPAAPAAPGDEAPAAPRSRARRGRGARAATDEQAAEPAAELDVLAELTGRGTAVLFQEPAPTGRRSRRRGAAALADAAPVSEEPSADDEELDEAGADGEQDGDGEQRDGGRRRRRRRGGRGRRRPGATGTEGDADEDADEDESDAGAEGGEPVEEDGEESSSSRRRRRRRRSGRGEAEPRAARDEVTALKGSTRLEAKRQRRREGRDAGRRRAVLTEAEFLARREAVERAMIVREAGGRVQIAVLEDGVLVEHFVSRGGGGGSSSSMIGNVYLGRVQNVLPSMEAAFVDIGKGRNAVLYAGEVNWDAAGLEGQPRRIEQALKSGDSVLVQVTKDPIGHKGARLTSQVTLAGRYLVYVPAGGMTGISRKLPENERTRLKKLLKEIVPDGAGVIVRTAAEGASEDELRRDVKRLQDQWAAIEKKQKSANAPALLQGEPDLAIRVVRDIFNDDFGSLVVQGDEVGDQIRDYVDAMAPDLVERVSRWTGTGDVFGAHRIDEQLAKAMDRKVWLPSGGSLVIDRTEAMTVIDVNTGKFTGAGGTLEETVTRNNLEAAEEIVRQLRLRDVGGIIVIDFIDMVLESNRDLVLRRLVECLGRDRTKHQVAEVTSLGLVQMTRKRVGQGLLEAFSESCPVCAGRGYQVRNEPVEPRGAGAEPVAEGAETKRPAKRRRSGSSPAPVPVVPVLPEAREAVKATLATIAAAAAHAHEHAHEHELDGAAGPEAASAEAQDQVTEVVLELGEPGPDRTPDGADEPAQPVGADDAGDARS